MSHLKRTPENRTKFMALMREGISIAKACQALGFSESTYKNWKRDDETFEAEVAENRAECANELHKVVMGGARDDPEFALKVLSRLFPEDYSETQRQETTIRLEMPGLLEASTVKAQAWLTNATDADWKLLDERAAKGELTDDDRALLEEPAAPDDPDADD